MKRKTLTLLSLIFITLGVFSQDPNFHIYLCFGQSNMEGSAKIEEKDKIGNNRFKLIQSMDCSDMLRKKGMWYTAVPPLFHCYPGLSPADYFGRNMVANLPDGIRVGLVAVAIGGCDIRLFDKDIYKDYVDTYPEDWFRHKVNAYGGNPYGRMIELAKLAQQEGVIKGILLHQGETNEHDENWPSYVEKVYNNILDDLSLEAEAVPLLAGEVANVAQGGKCSSMNVIIASLPETIPTAYVIPSKGCSVRKDSVHFNSKGVRELGKRYAEKMLELEGYSIDETASDTEEPLISTEVLPDNKVAFRIYAPNAKEVKLQSDDKWDKVEFVKSEHGIWEGTWSNVQAGAYRYRFLVDGVAINDPMAENTKEDVSIFKMSSGDEFFAMKDEVPHGAIAERHYYSETLKTIRRSHVWTPAGYEKSKVKLPVLYLIHGGGDTDKAWPTIGCVGNILDNLMAEGKIEPMMVVMPNGTIEADNILDRVPLFEKDLMTSIIPFIESNYKVHPDAKHRAIMGLSMGGLETLEVVTNYPNDFAYIGVLSSGWWISDSWIKKRGILDDKTARADNLKEISTAFNQSVKMLYFTQGGPEDLAYDNGMQTIELFKAAGIEYQYSESPGGHTWMVWRKNLYDLAPLLFK